MCTGRSTVGTGTCSCISTWGSGSCHQILAFFTRLPCILKILTRSVHVVDADNVFFHFEMLAVLC